MTTAGGELKRGTMSVWSVLTKSTSPLRRMNVSRSASGSRADHDCQPDPVQRQTIVTPSIPSNTSTTLRAGPLQALNVPPAAITRGS